MHRPKSTATLYAAWMACLVVVTWYSISCYLEVHTKHIKSNVRENGVLVSVQEDVPTYTLIAHGVACPDIPIRGQTVGSFHECYDLCHSVQCPPPSRGRECNYFAYYHENQWCNLHHECKEFLQTVSNGSLYRCDSCDACLDDMMRENPIREYSRKEIRDELQERGVTVTVLVFYGRRRYVNIIRHYWHMNLWKQGGVVSKVVFAPLTDDKNDIAVMRRIQKEDAESYKVWNDLANSTYGFVWHKLKQQCKQDPISCRNEIMLKIDDDILWMSPGAMDNIVAQLLFDPTTRKRASSERGYLFYSANYINHVKLDFLHQRIGALVSDNYFEYHAYGDCSWNSTECAEDTLDNFVRNYQSGTMSKYDFGFHDFTTLQIGHDRWSIGFFGFWKSFVLDLKEDMRKIVDDELHLSERWLAKVGMDSAAIGRSMAVHFAYFTQREHLDTHRDDLLEIFEVVALTNRNWFDKITMKQDLQQYDPH